MADGEQPGRQPRPLLEPYTPAPYFQSLRRFSGAVRDLVAAAMDRRAPAQVLDALTSQIESHAQSLRAAGEGRLRVVHGEHPGTAVEQRNSETSPMRGTSNPVAPPMDVRLEGDTVVGTAVFNWAYEGPPGHVMGGMIACAFDSVLGAAQTLAGQGGMTAGLFVNYLKPAPLNQELRFEAWVERVEGRRIYTIARLLSGDTLCATAEGTFVRGSVDNLRARHGLTLQQPPG